MARVSTSVLIAIVALALVCGSVSVSASKNEERGAVLSRSRRFSVEGIVTCLAGLGLAGLNQAVGEIEGHCDKTNNFKYRVCALGKFAKLGPEYVKCVAQS